MKVEDLTSLEKFNEMLARNGRKQVSALAGGNLLQKTSSTTTIASANGRSIRSIVRCIPISALRT